MLRESRRFAWIFALLALLSLLSLGAAGCGGENADAPKKSKALFNPDVPREDTPEAIDAELSERFQKTKKAAAKMFSEEAGRKVLTHKYGKTVLPEKPQRIAVVGLEDTAISMGLPIVAAHVAKSSYLYEKFQSLDITNISINADTKTINLEEVQAVQPDLILLRDSYDKNAYNALSKIAPVAPFNLQKEETAVLAAAEAADRPELGERRLKEYYERVKAARMRIKGVIGDDTVVFLRILKKDVRLYPYSVNSTNSFMYELLNLRPDPMVVALDTTKNNMAISMESLPELKADYIAISSGYGANNANSQAAAEKRYEELRADPLWHTLPAVRKGHVLDVDSLIWNAHGLIAKELAIDDLDRWLGGEKQP